MGGLAAEPGTQGRRGAVIVLIYSIKLIRFIFYTGLICVALAAIGITTLVFHAASDLPKLPHPLSRIIETPQTRIFTSSGQMLITLGERNTVPLNRVSRDFINAILAVEDHRFFDHHGINKLRTLKALYITLFEPGQVQGASTITQQLAKNLFFTFEQSYIRKFKEMLVAFQIEASNSKEEILHAYINQIHFGAGAQGVEKAAKVFFNKSAIDLTLSEAALLAGLPKSPTGYNPFHHFDRAMERRDVVLNRMASAGFISADQARETSMMKPELHARRTDNRTGSYFLDTVINQLIKTYGQEVVYYGGIKVTTTLDMKLQSTAIGALQSGLTRLDELMGLQENDPVKPQGALVAVDPASGAVKAMLGGRNYYESEFNRAVRSKRQPGSGFKPFLYYQAMQQLGYHPATVMTDRPVIIPVKGAPDWEPENFSNRYRGDMILKKALTLSVNTIAAQLMHEIGPGPVIKAARTCGIKSPLDEVYSLALGTSLVSPLEMAGAFSTFATLGVRHEPFMIWRVEDPFGRVLYEHIIQEKQVLEPSVAYQVLDMMASVIDQGSGRIIRQSGFNHQAAGKTGTTDRYNDAWFTGFTPTLCTSVWTGFDKNRPLIDINGVGITGGRGAGPIWAEFMENALKGQPERHFPIPDDIRFVAVNAATGCRIDAQAINDTEADSLVQEPVEEIVVPLKPDQFPCDPVPEADR